jgi:branched-chain amino acid transport system ATP-binding protein
VPRFARRHAAAICETVGTPSQIATLPRAYGRRTALAEQGPPNQTLIFDRVREINTTGVSVLMVEQNARRCLQICSRAYVLDQGRNAYEGTGEALLTDPKVIELYLGTLARAR